MDIQIKAPKVSVCVITYNQARYIGQCLQSIVDQHTDFDFEVLVGDDCSTDGTRAIVQKFVDNYPTVVKPVFHPVNVGGTANFLSVHALASGEYVCHCDGDDFWLPGKLSSQAKLMDENSDVVQVWHRQHFVDQDSAYIGVFPKRFPELIFGRRLSYDDLAHSYGLVGQHSSQIYRRSARSILTRDGRPTIDYFDALDIGSKGISLYMKEFLGCYRVVAGGSVTQQADGRDLVDVCMIDAVVHFAEEFPDSKKALKANLLVRAFGAMIRRRPNWRAMIGTVSAYPTSLGSIARSIVVTAAHKI